MEVKRPISNVISTLAATGGNVKTDDTAAQYLICVDNAADPLVPVLGPIPYGKTGRLSYVASQTEVRQMAIIGAVASGNETIVAERRYRVEIGNNRLLYETAYAGNKVFSYTAPAVLSGDAATDRANVHTSLSNKINAYAGVDVAASPVHVFDYTLGGAVAPTLGEVMTQETSGVTMLVVAYTLTSGTWAGSDAAGKIWVAFVSSEDDLLETAKTLTGGTSGSVLTTTNATIVKATGLAVRDNAGYFISRKGREGISLVQATQGFSSTSFSVAVAGVYARGIGSVYAQYGALQYDHSKLDAIEGDIEFELIRGGAFDITKKYRKYIIEVEDGDVDTLAFQSIATKTNYFLWVDESESTNLTNFNSALETAVAK